jgi:hydroxymethylbilane synthase
LIIRMATRGSRLALIQASEVDAKLRALGYTTRQVVVESHGDRDRSTPLYRMSVRGIFEKEVDRAVLEGEADIAVHSLKDVPYELPPGLVLAAVPRRGPAYDAVVPMRLHFLPSGSKVATGSIRRMLTVKALRPDLLVEGVRGNVDTRLSKLVAGGFDALITAEVALRRLGWAKWFRLNPNVFVPSPGQGALGVTCRSDRPDILGALRRINSGRSSLEVGVEREVARRIGGGCTSPLGVYAKHVSKNTLEVRVGLVKPSGGLLRFKVRGGPHNIVGRTLREFKELGGPDYVDHWRKQEATL